MATFAASVSSLAGRKVDAKAYLVSTPQHQMRFGTTVSQKRPAVDRHLVRCKLRYIQAGKQGGILLKLTTTRDCRWRPLFHTRRILFWPGHTSKRSYLTIEMANEPNIKAASADDIQRRLRLRVAAKMMGYLAFAGMVYVFISALMSGDGEVPSVPSLRVDISGMQAGDAQFLTWEGRPVLIYRRSNADVVTLRSTDERIRDPDSARSTQPEFAQNAWRSQEPDYFVAIALGTGQGCTVEVVPAGGEIFQGQAWQGGFMDSCGKDRFDLAGRVFDGQYASENLQVPQYTLQDQMLVLGK